MNKALYIKIMVYYHAKYILKETFINKCIFVLIGV